MLLFLFFSLFFFSLLLSLSLSDRKVFPSSQTREVRTVAKKLIHFITGLRRISQPSKTTPPLATNHTPSAVSTATSPSSVSTATSSTPQTNQNGCTATQVTSTYPPNSVTQQTTFAPVQFGRKSSSVSLQSSSVASFGSTPTPPPSLSVSPSPSAPSSNVSSRESTPSLRISPDLETFTPSPQPQTKRSDLNSLCNDVIPAKNDVMASRSSSLNSHISPTEAHFTASSLPSSSYSSSNSAIPRCSSLSPSPVPSSTSPLRSSSTPSLPSPPHTVTSLPTREQPIATPTSTRSDDQNSTSPLENPNTLTNVELEEDNELNEENFSDRKVEKLRNDTTPVRPKVSGCDKVGETSLNDIHDVGKFGVKRTLVDMNGEQEEDEMDCGDIENGADLRLSVGVNSALLASVADRDDRSRSGTPPNPSGPETVPEAKRIRLDSHTNNKQQQTIEEQKTPQQESQVLSNLSNRTSKPRQTSFITSSIRFTNNKSPTLVTSGGPGEQSNKSTTSSSDSVRPVCLWENCMR